MTASLVFGGIAAASTGLRDITVEYLPLRYVFDGTEKAPPSDQPGFVYSGHTYVPLRFMSEALDKKVNWDGETSTIYVGRRPAPLPVLWSAYKTDGPATFDLKYFPSGALTVRGQEMPDSLLVTSFTPPPQEVALADRTSSVELDFNLDGRYQTLSGTLFVPLHYFGHPEERKIAQLIVVNEQNSAIYRSDVLPSSSANVPFKIDVAPWTRIKVYFLLYHNQGVPVADTLLQTQIGISNFVLQ